VKAEIVKFVREACARYGMEAIYIPDGDVYSLMYKGKAVQNFNTQQFMTFPKTQRMKEYMPLIKIGLARNLNEMHKSQFYLPRHNGIKIC